MSYRILTATIAFVLAVSVTGCSSWRTPAAPAASAPANTAAASSSPSAPAPTPTASAQLPTTPTPASAQPPASSTPSPSPDYRLPIVGSSAAITGKAWTSMLAWRTQIAEFAVEHPGKVVINGPEKPRVALTFDDGPDEVNTLSVMKTLDEYGVKGSFFLIGEKVRKHPNIAKKLADGGHLVLSHSYRHVELTKAGDADVRSYLRDAQAEIKSATGLSPAWIRTPYGETDERVVREASAIGQSIALWSLDSLDWSQTKPEPIVSNVLDHVRDGDIILMHSGEDNSVSAKALPAVIEGLRKAGYEMVDLAALLDRPAYVQ